jgi:hypothetical protein
VAGKGESGLMVLVGDSIGTHWLPALQQAAASRGMRLVVLTKSSCPIVDEPFVYARIHRRFTECEEWREAVASYVQAATPDIVVIGSASSYGFNATQWTQGSRRIIDRIGEGVRTVVVLAPSPTLPFHGPGCVMTEGKESSGRIEVAASACTTDLASAENREVIQALGEATDASTNSHLLYLNDLVCPDGHCRALSNGDLVYRDQQHLNATFVESLGGLLEARLPSAVAAPSNR